MSKALIISIVRKGWGDKILEASMEAGAHGGTIMLGRGAGIHEKQKLLGIPIEPEKEILISVVDSEESEAILQAIARSGELEKPGSGIAFIVPVQNVIGVTHLSEKGGEEGVMEIS